MISIPDQLKDCRFILINPSNDPKYGKRPIEKNWTTDNNYSKQEMEVKSITKYGVLCGHNGLIVIDCDSQAFQDVVLNNGIFQNTFTVKTAMKGMYHFYFRTEQKEPKTKRIDLNKKRIADIQGTGTQVLGPGSSINSKEYDIVNNSDIQYVKYDSLIKFCSSLFPDTEVVETKEKKRKTKSFDVDDGEIDPVISFIKSKLTISDILNEVGISTTKGKNCECPFHSSVSGQCLSYDDHQWHCFHCERGGSMFDLYMEIKKIDFMTAKMELADKVGVPAPLVSKAKKLIKIQQRADAIGLIVRNFYKKNNIYTIRNDMKSEMWIYFNGIYVPHGKSYIKKFVRAIVGDFYTSHIANQVIAQIEADTFIDDDKFFNPKQDNLIAVKNGILNVITRDIKPFTPDKIFFNKFPIYFNPDIKNMPNIYKFLESTMKSDQDIHALQEMFGYCFLDNCKYKKAFMFIGTGDNGKSKVLDLLSALIGEENMSAVSLHALDEDQFAAASLFGKYINICGDIGQGVLKETMMFKNIVSGDSISANRKFLTPIMFKNKAKMIFAANNLPETEDKSDGFFTRWQVFDFPYTFLPHESYDNLSDEDKAKGMYKIADKNIMDKLLNVDEMSCLLNWSLEGLRRLIDNKDFTESSSVDNIKNYWLRKSSSMRAFIMDRVEITMDDQYIAATDLHTEYIQYCQDNRLKPQMKKDCTAILETYPIKYKPKKIYNGVNSFEQKRVWEGLRLR